MKKNVAVAEELYERAEKAAAADRISVDDFVSSLLLHQLNSRAYVDLRAKLFRQEEFERALKSIPDIEPEDHDRV